MDIIVNADDLGISSQVNDAIFDLLGRGRVTSATMIGNGPEVEQACRRIDSFPGCSFGAHLNVTQFRPLSGGGKLGPLLGDNGEFDATKIREVDIDSALAEGILEEFSSQIENLNRLGVNVSHLDSHNFVFSIPKMFLVMKKLQRKFRIRKARISRNIYADGLIKGGLTAYNLALGYEDVDSDIRRAKRLKKSFYNFMLRNYYRTKTTQGFSGFRMFYEYARSEKMNFRSFEVVVHPGNDYYDLDEIEILKGPWEDELGFPVRLISYHELE